MKLAEKMSGSGPSLHFEVLAKARALEKQGSTSSIWRSASPISSTPPHVVEAGQRALGEGWTKYGPTPGLPELRESIAAYISRTRGVTVGAENVCVVPGGKPIMFFAMIALLEAGDEVIYPDPAFPIYESMIRFLGAVPVPVPLVESRGFSFDLDTLRDRLSHKTRFVILNSPANPTGGVTPAGDLVRTAELLRERDLIVLSDEIYSRIWYETEPVSITSVDPAMLEKTIILDGFSKTYSMTGWRLGYGVMPVWLAEAVTKLMVNSNSCTASFTQRAGLAALEGPQDAVTAMVVEFRRRRDAMVKALNGIPGFRCSLPAGAFYAFPNVTGTGMRSKDLADLLLNEAGVAALNGAAFGEHGDGFLRFSYANSLENIEDAMTRIQRISERWKTLKSEV